MASSPVSPSTILLLLLLLLLLSTTLPFTLAAAAAVRGGFMVKLLHRDAPGSPYYNSSATPYDLVRAAARRSVSRAQSLASTTHGSFRSGLLFDGPEYLIPLSLGTPPSKFLFIFDTGSAVTWTQCAPCSDCYEQNAPLFNPSMSSTYKEITCNSQLCSQGGTRCNDVGAGLVNSSCPYSINYGDNSYSRGTLSLETFSFGDDNANVSIPNLVFGCSHVSKGTFQSVGAGLVGLAPGPVSLVSQLSSTKFSYCLDTTPPLSSPPPSVLNFGDRAVVGGDISTPLIINSSGYYVTLEAIVVGGAAQGGGKTTPHDTASSSSSSTTGNVMVDSGTTYTFLDDGVVEQLEKKLSSIVKLRQVKPPPASVFTLCFDAPSGLTCDYPDITFQFTGASVKLSPLNTFVAPLQGMECLAILRKGNLGPSTLGILGSVAQQNYHVGYDLDNKMLFFKPVANCAN